jgi:hypothetical protein
MDNPEKQATLDTQDTRPRRKKTQTKTPHTTIGVGTSARGIKKRSNHKLKLKKDRRHKRQTMIYKTLHTKD